MPPLKSWMRSLTLKPKQIQIAKRMATLRAEADKVIKDNIVRICKANDWEFESNCLWGLPGYRVRDKLGLLVYSGEINDLVKWYRSVFHGFPDHGYRGGKWY